MEPKKPGRGRPKKEASDRLPQFSIRLSPKAKVGLHMLARSRDSSLSQAVEFAVMQALRSNSVGGRTLEEQMLTATDLREGFGPIELVYEAMLASAPLLLMHLPSELQKPDERLFTEVMGILLDHDGNGFGIRYDSPEAEAILEDSLRAYHTGESANAVADRWIAKLNALDAKWKRK